MIVKIKGSVRCGGKHSTAQYIGASISMIKYQECNVAKALHKRFCFVMLAEIYSQLECGGSQF